MSRRGMSTSGSRAGLCRALLVAGACLAAVLGASSGLVATGAEGPPAADPRMAPRPAAVPTPGDNPTTPEKVALGKLLFFDPRLSGDNTMSCATCHRPDKAFGDGLPRAKGAGGKPLGRNTPSLLNVGFRAAYFWDGRAKSLEEQALLPIEAPDEMNQDLGALEKELNAVPGYVARFRAAFGTDATRVGIAKALAAFQRTLVTGPSPYDRYLGGDEGALSEQARRGLDLFFGDADCARCHSGPLLTDEKFYRLGASDDRGRGAISGKDDDHAKFRTPSLRDVARTGPYMHDGRLATLGDVVYFYFRGIPAHRPDGLPLDVEALQGIPFTEMLDLTAFLESLSGEQPKIAPPQLP